MPLTPALASHAHDHGPDGLARPGGSVGAIPGRSRKQTRRDVASRCTKPPHSVDLEVLMVVRHVPAAVRTIRPTGPDLPDTARAVDADRAVGSRTVKTPPG